jgi:hypothetical protein
MAKKTSKPLTGFLKKLYDNPALVNQFRKDFEGALRKSGLSDSLKEVLRTRNLKKVVHTVVDEHIPTTASGKKLQRLAMGVFIVWGIAAASMTKPRSQKARS